MPITPEVLAQILKDYEKPEDLLSENGLLQQLTKALERASFERRADASSWLREKRPRRLQLLAIPCNGSTPKVVTGKRGQVEIEVPGDRNGDSEPQLVKKNQTRFHS